MLKNNKEKVIYINQRRKNIINIQEFGGDEVMFMVQIDFSQNLITNIGEIGKYRFQGLKLLNLSINLIFSLQPFAKSHFPKLQKLFLHGNAIESIEPLMICNLSSLKVLRLGFSNRGNQINEIDHIKEANWLQIEQICLDSNNIFNLLPLYNIQYKQLTHLYIANNNIQHFSAQVLNNLVHIKVLSLSNYLTHIKFLKKSFLPFIQYIDLSNNYILEIDGLHQTCMNKLNKFNICQNELIIIEYFLRCEWKQASKIIYSHKNLIYRDFIDGQIYQKYLQSTS